jgi:G6PDH family F420-dependent oxidoreductase
MCWGPDEEQAVALAHRLWANEQLPGELAQILPTPAHFEQAMQLVTPEMVGSALPCGPDPERYVEAVQAYVEAGFDEIYVNQIGPDQEGFLKFFTDEVRPRLSL